MRSNLRITAGLIGATVAGVVTSRYRHDLRIARKRAEWDSRLVLTSAGPVEYAEAGRGPTVFSIHGAGGGWDQGLTIAGDLRTAGYHIVAPSRFGYLRTPLPADASPQAQADAHAALLDALGIDKAAVIAFSAGAPSAMQLAIRHPDRVTALILVVPAAYVPRPDGETSMRTPPGLERLFTTALQSDLLYWASRHSAPETLIRTVLGTPPEDLENVSLAERERIDEILDQILPISSRRPGLMNDAKVTGSLERYALEKIVAPTLLVSVADDGYGTFAGARYSAEHIPDSRFIAYAKGGHMCAGHFAEINREIGKFLRRAHVRARPSARRQARARRVLSTRFRPAAGTTLKS